jgi:hypothetical protein
MSKSKKHDKKNKNKNKNKKKAKTKYNKTIKRGYKDEIIPLKTPENIMKISNKIANKLSNKSYSPTINRELVTLKSIPRKELLDCNIEMAFEQKEPLKIGIPGFLYGKNCFEYYTPEAKKYLLKNLSANKHIDIAKIVPPIQLQSNCWFNAMFVTFFISDKGRKFFHFLRQLMIEGKNKDGTPIPDGLRNAFALLNFGVDASLTGNKFAYKLNTNSIIHSLYKGIPSVYKSKFPYIVDVDNAGNPLLYYMSIINYLNNNSIQLLVLRDANNNWKDKLVELIKINTHLPHIIVLEIYDESANVFNKKPISFTVNNGKYKIDSAVVRDISKQHFCAAITCEDNEMGYDGMSFHRMVPLEWKQKMNNNINWQFEGTRDYDGKPLEWNFMKSYQMLIYYRVK